MDSWGGCFLLFKLELTSQQPLCFGDCWQSFTVRTLWASCSAGQWKAQWMLKREKKKGQSDLLSLCSFHEKEMVAVCVLSLQYMCWSQKVAGGQPGLQTESRNLPSLWSPFDEAVPLMPCVLCCCMVISWCVSGALYIDVWVCVHVVVHILVAVKLHRVLPRFMFLVQSGEVTGSYILDLRVKSILKRETWILRLCFSHFRTCSHCSKQHFKVAATLYLSLPSFINCSYFHW